MIYIDQIKNTRHVNENYNYYLNQIVKIQFGSSLLSTASASVRAKYAIPLNVKIRILKKNKT